jgi:gluconolactonase
MLTPYSPITPGIQHVAPDGTVRYLFDDGFLAPNDLSATADGTWYFTDPPHHPPPPEPGGRVHVVDAAGMCRVLADGFSYCNGILVEPGGTLVIVEARGLLRLDPADGERSWIVEHLGDNAGDGMCADVDGRLYVCCTRDHAVRVFEPDGTEVDGLDVPGDGLVTNCCFGGDDLRSLFVTEGMPGRVVVFEGMPTPGLAVHRVPLP